LLENIGATSADCAQARMKLNKKVDKKLLGKLNLSKSVNTHLLTCIKN